MNAADDSVKLFAFHIGGLVADMASYDPWDPKVGTEIYSPNFFYLVQHPDGNVLFDCGIRSDVLDDQGSVADMTIEFGPEDTTEAKLAQVGLAPKDIDHVVMSHLHWDHSGGLRLFPHATVHVNKREMEFAFSPPVYQAVFYDPKDFDHDLKWREVEGEVDLFGDGTVVMVPTPGHTPGHQSLLVRTNGGAILLLSDAVFEVDKMRQRVLPTIVWNPDEMVASYDYIEEVEQKHGAELIPAHELEFRTKVRMAPEAWYE